MASPIEQQVGDLNRQTAALFHQARFAEAAASAAKALDLARTLGGEHSLLADALNNYAALEHRLGRHAAALPLLEESLRIERSRLGNNHPDLAAALNNLAEVHHHLNNFAAAEPLYRQALDILQRAHQERTPLYATLLANLASLHASMGHFQGAEPLYREAVAIQREVNGAGHPDYGRALLNLATLYGQQQNFWAAEPLLQQCLEVFEKSLDAGHPTLALAKNNLAELYRQTGRFQAAEKLYEEAAEAQRERLGDAHPDTARTLNNQALLAKDRGDYDEAERLYQQALTAWRQTHGEYHPDVAAALLNLSAVAAARRQFGEALALFEQALAIDDHMIGVVFGMASEEQRMAHLLTIEENLHAFLSLVGRYLPTSPAAVNRAFDLVLRRKALGAEALNVQREAILGGRYPDARPLLEELGQIRSEIAQTTLGGPGSEGLEAHQQALTQLTARRDEVETELARRLPEMNMEQRLRTATRSAVAEALKRVVPEGVLVEFVRYPVFDFQAIAAKGQRRWQPDRYAAFVLKAGAAERITFLDIGEAGPIDRLVDEFLQSLDDVAGPRRDMGRKARPSTPTTDVGLLLRQTLLDKLLASLGATLTDSAGPRLRLLLAPDGQLSRLPFEVLPVSDGRHLLDVCSISYVGCARDVLRFTPPVPGTPNPSLVLADPDFDLGGTKEVTNAPQTPSRLSRDLDRERLHFARLPGTRFEGRVVASRLNVARPWLQQLALKGRLKTECRSPFILHLATHGFFLENQAALGEGGARLEGPPPENPLLRSGLALTGANTWVAGGSPPAEAEDGLLTAEEVAGLDLTGTELVVLSACDTGLGHVQNGEGVFGLRRAVFLAGARTLVMSLWKVDDLATAVLMERFYENLLVRRLPRDESLRQAQTYTREVTIGEIRPRWLVKRMIELLAGGDAGIEEYLRQLAARPNPDRPFPAPIFWGAFICQGDPSSLTAPA